MSGKRRRRRCQKKGDKGRMLVVEKEVKMRRRRGVKEKRRDKSREEKRSENRAITTIGAKPTCILL